MAITGNQQAYKYALFNVARFGASRFGYVGGRAFISVGGVPVSGDVQLGTLEIVDELNETPNTCRFRIIGPTTITTGQEVVITLGSTNGSRLFAGHVLTTTQSYWAKPVNVRTDVLCVDYTWQFGFPKVTQRYVNQSASWIVIHLIGTYAGANGFGGVHVAPGLPAIPEITFTNEDLGDALSRTANRIGAYWYVDYYKDVHFFFTDAGQGPRDLVPTHPSLSDVRRETERSQTLTRVYVEGRGSRLLSPVAVGDTLIPLEAVDMFAALPDVFLKASFQGSEGGAQHLNFSGVVPGGQGALVGTGIGPTSRPTATVQAGAGVTSGPHYYAVTFVTAAGESLCGPTAFVETGAVPDPTVAPGPLTQFPTHTYTGSNIPIGHQCYFAYSYATGPTGSGVTNFFTLQSPFAGPITSISNQDPLNPTMSAPIQVPIPYSTDPRVKWIIVWAAIDVYPNKWNLYHANIPNNPAGGTYYDSAEGTNITDSGYYAPTSNTTGQNQVALSAIPIGSAAVTQRKLYRTAVPATAQLRLLATLANNTATTYLDVLADASLGANAPANDTSGLAQSAGQVVAGATTLPVAGTAAFQTGGGWAVIGNGEQVIRYTGLSAIALTGIPASGLGAITATIAFNSTVTGAAMLTGIPTSGIRSITQALSAGDEIYLVVQVDDTTRQGQLAAAVGGTGIREEWIQDRRLSIGEARARGQATLSERMLDQIRVSYTSRDLNTRSGKEIVANLPAPTNLVGTFRIQHVVINNFRPHPEQPPTFTVQASSSRFSFEDLLRLVSRDVAK